MKDERGRMTWFLQELLVGSSTVGGLSQKPGRTLLKFQNPTGSTGCTGWFDGAFILLIPFILSAGC
jgi:hypothetical protein